MDSLALRRSCCDNHERALIIKRDRRGHYLLEREQLFGKCGCRVDEAVHGITGGWLVGVFCYLARLSDGRSVIPRG